MRYSIPSEERAKNGGLIIFLYSVRATRSSGRDINSFPRLVFQYLLFDLSKKNEYIVIGKLGNISNGCLVLSIFISSFLLSYSIILNDIRPRIQLSS